MRQYNPSDLNAALSLSELTSRLGYEINTCYRESRITPKC
jgi:hypothetical protein